MDSSSGSDLVKMWEDGDLKGLVQLPFLGDTDSSPFYLGWAHLVSAFPKGGKTELLHALCMDWVKDYKIAYFTEEDKTTWAKRLLDFKSKPLEQIMYYHALGEGGANIVGPMADSEADIFILDTARLLGIRNENDNAEVHGALAPIISLVKSKEKTLIIVHHRNKTDELNQGLEISGAHAFLAIVDVGLVVTKGNKNEQRRFISGYGRITPVEELVYERLDTGETKLVGFRDEFKISAVKKRILDTVLKSSWMSTSDIRTALTPTPSLRQVQSALRELADERWIERDPGIEVASVKGKTLVWRQTDEVTRKYYGLV